MPVVAGATELAGAQIELLLDGEDEVDSRPFESARTALAHLEGDGLEECLALASNQLRALANDWRQDGEPVLDAAAFRARMVPGALSLDRHRTALGVNVGEVFGDHAIEILLDATFRPVSAQMA